jgi:hypothetical protein
VAGCPLVVLLAIGVVAVIAWMVVAGLLGQGREVLARVTAGLEEAGSLPGMVDLDATQTVKALGELVQTLLSGLLSGLGSVTVLIVGIVTGLFIPAVPHEGLAAGRRRDRPTSWLRCSGFPTVWAARSWPTPSTRSGATPWGSPSSG